MSLGVHPFLHTILLQTPSSEGVGHHKSHCLKVRLNTTGHELLEYTNAYLKADSLDLRLSSQGKEIHPHDTLRDKNILADTNVQVLFRLRGGSKNFTTPPRNEFSSKMNSWPMPDQSPPENPWHAMTCEPASTEDETKAEVHRLEDKLSAATTKALD